MPLFVKLDPGWLHHPKVVTVGPFARLLYIGCLSYSVEQRSDGFIPSRVASRVTDVDDPDPSASFAALVKASLLTECEGGYMIHDYADWQMTRDQIDSARESAAERARRYRASKSVTRESRVTATGDATRESQSRSRSRSVRGSNEPLKDSDDGFAAFWLAYPRKAGKPQAAKAWKQATRRADVAAVMAGLELWAEHWQTIDAKYVPHPTTWLNRDGWSDAVPSPRPAQGKVSTGMDALMRLREGRSGAVIDVREAQ